MNGVSSPLLGRQMELEMGEQPALLAHLVDRLPQMAMGLGAVLAARPNGIVLLARGSSMHAAQFWRYVVEISTGVPTLLAAPSVASIYHAPTSYMGWLCVSLSQSGQTPEIIAATQQMAASGATVLVVTNESDSPLAKLGHVTWALGWWSHRMVFMAPLAVAHWNGMPWPRRKRYLANRQPTKPSAKFWALIWANAAAGG